ncbi:hypothetical protein ACFLUP_04565 [Chloroflexota bacterium]
MKVKKCRLTKTFLALVIGVSIMAACSPSPPAKSDFNLLFRYGVGANNDLNTFSGTYTKDMINAPSITVPLLLTDEELDRIYQKMIEIDFFDYPEEFSVSLPPGGLVGMITPHSSYYFRVENNSVIKELRWEDKITNENNEADNLRELIKLIRDIIESKEEYQKLPEPTGGYM